MSGEKVVMVPLVFKFMAQSDGTTGWVYYDVEGSAFETLGPEVESITFYTQTENRTSQHAWKVVLWWSMDGRTWDGPTDCFAALTANALAVPSDFTNKQKLGPHIKLAVAVQNISGGGVERALVSCMAAFTRRT